MNIQYRRFADLKKYFLLVYCSSAWPLLGHCLRPSKQQCRNSKSCITGEKREIAVVGVYREKQNIPEKTIKRPSKSCETVPLGGIVRERTF
jgi:hypothetical protein